MIYAALLIGAFFGACGVAALLLIIGANRSPAPTMHARRPPHPMPKYDDHMRSLSVPMPQCKEGRKPCIGCYGGDLPCVCKHATDWDVAIASERKQENTVRYEFLGMTGHEEEWLGVLTMVKYRADFYGSSR